MRPIDPAQFKIAAPPAHHGLGLTRYGDSPEHPGFCRHCHTPWTTHTADGAFCQPPDPQIAVLICWREEFSWLARQARRVSHYLRVKNPDLYVGHW
jgi:hypothetical protein